MGINESHQEDNASGSWTTPLLKAVILTFMYYALARIGLLLALDSTNASPIWPPTGLAIASLFVLGYRYWPSILCGAFLANFAVFSANHIAMESAALIASMTIALGNTGEALVGAWLLRRFTSAVSPFERTDHIFLFSGIVMVASLISAAVGTWSLLHNGLAPDAAMRGIALSWWLGDVGGAIIVMPLLLCWYRRRAWPSGPSVGEAAAGLMVVIGATVWIFGGHVGGDHYDRAAVAIFFPLITWAAFRFGQRGASLTTLLTATAAVIGTMRGNGPFTGGPLNDSLILLVSFVSILSVTGLVLAADLQERRRLSPAAITPQRLLSSWLTLNVALIVTMLIWHGLSSDTERRANEEFNLKAADLRNRLASRMTDYVVVLQGARGLVEVIGVPDRARWKTYVDSLNIGSNLPGTLGIGFAPALKRDEVGALVEAMRRDGVSAFNVWPQVTADLAVPVGYIEPAIGRNLRAPGYDMFSEPTRRAALEKARDNGEPVLSGKVTLVQEDGKMPQAGALLYLPVYRGTQVPVTIEERRSGLRAYVYGAFRIDDLVRGVFDDRLDKLVLEIFDGDIPDPERRIYFSGNDVTLPGFELRLHTNVVNHNWLLRFRALPVFETEIDRQKAQLALVTGAIISLLLFVMLRSLSLTTERARRIADERDQALRDTETTLTALAKSSRDAIVIFDQAGQVVSWSRGASELFGYTEEEALGMPQVRLVPESRREEFSQAAERINRDLAPADQAYTQETEALTSSGRIVPIEVSLTSWKTSAGCFYGSIARDISERQRSTAFLRGLFDQAPDAIVVVDETGVIVRSNGRSATLFGYRQERMVGLKIEELIPTSVQRHHQQHMADYFRNPMRWAMGLGMSLNAVRADHSTFPVAIALAPVQTNDGTFVVATISDISELKRKEDALRLSEERLRLTVDGAIDYAILMLDAQGHIAGWNAGAQRIKGYRADEIIGCHLSILYTESDRARQHPEQVLDQAANKGHYSEEGWRVRKDGSLFWASVSLTAVRDHEGELLGFSKVTRDLTEQRAAREMIDVISRRLTIATHAAGIGVWEVSPEVGIATWDQQMYEMFDVDAATTNPYSAWFERVHPEDRSAIAAFAHAALNASVRCGIEHRIVLGDGQIRHIKAEGQAVPAVEGKAATLIGVAWDITEQRVAQQQLQATSALQSAILGAAGVSIIATQPDGIVTLFNSAAERMLGWRATEMIGLQTPAVIHDWIEVEARATKLGAELGVHIDPGFEAFVAKARRGLPDEDEWTYVRKDGSRFPVLLSVTAIRGGDGEISGFLGIASDVTVRYRQERAIRDALHEKETLLKEVYHRVKNNLQVITSLFNLQARTLPVGTAQNALREGAERVRAMALVHEKLYQSTTLSSINVEDYVQTLCKDLASASGADMRGIDIITDIAVVQIGLETAVPLGLLMNELIANSIKHGFPEGRRGEIRIRLVAVDAMRGLLEISDNGVGYPESALQQKGKSLGLRLIATLSRQLDGALTLSNQEGAFARLSFRLTEPIQAK